jgi:hypothetical protein
MVISSLISLIVLPVKGEDILRHLPVDEEGIIYSALTLPLISPLPAPSI